jgi:hypothetical protein
VPEAWRSAAQPQVDATLRTLFPLDGFYGTVPAGALQVAV